jgi:hypothetical protein
MSTHFQKPHMGILLSLSSVLLTQEKPFLMTFLGGKPSLSVSVIIGECLGDESPDILDSVRVGWMGTQEFRRPT